MRIIKQFKWNGMVKGRRSYAERPRCWRLIFGYSQETGGGSQLIELDDYLFSFFENIYIKVTTLLPKNVSFFPLYNNLLLLHIEFWAAFNLLGGESPINHVSLFIISPTECPMNFVFVMVDGNSLSIFFFQIKLLFVVTIFHEFSTLLFNRNPIFAIDTNHDPFLFWGSSWRTKILLSSISFYGFR